MVSSILEWLHDPDNRGAAQVAMAGAALLVAWATGLLRWAVGVLRRRRPEDRSKEGPHQTASGGGVNVAGNARDVTTHGWSRDDPS
jgi:hypothetical protein